MAVRATIGVHWRPVARASFDSVEGTGVRGWRYWLFARSTLWWRTRRQRSRNSLRNLLAPLDVSALVPAPDSRALSSCFQTTPGIQDIVPARKGQEHTKFRTLGTCSFESVATTVWSLHWTWNEHKNNASYIFGLTRFTRILQRNNREICSWSYEGSY